MTELLNHFNQIVAAINGIMWHPAVLYTLLATGIAFTFWSGFSQFKSLTHGIAVVAGKYDKAGGPGAISHFQALSAALSATVGVGNISGVALAIALGGPGAVFWMWVVAFLGMAIKNMEVTQSMLYRNTDDPDNPHGGPMWVAWKGLAQKNSKYEGLGRKLGVFFCITLLVATVTGGLIFQAWSAATVTRVSFDIPQIGTGLVLAVLVGMVIIGGVSRVGRFAGRVVPFMCGLYLIAAVYVILVKVHMIPEMFALIFEGAFGTLSGQGAFIGGTAGWAFGAGMQRAFFSNEAGQGSSSIAHSAAKTDEPAREGLVAGLEPFIDTLVVCTLTALVILMSGSWNREPDHLFGQTPVFQAAEPGLWQLPPMELIPEEVESISASSVFMRVKGDHNSNTDNNLQLLTGQVVVRDGSAMIQWPAMKSDNKPEPADPGYFSGYDGAALTALSFNLIQPGLGKWLVTLATLLFALSTMISWSYYGEQGVVFIFGEKGVMPYKLIYCLLIIVSTAGLIRGINEISNLSMMGTGAMLMVNVPIMWIFGSRAVEAQRAYLRKSNEN